MMSSAEFLSESERISRWIARYRDNLEEHPVFSAIEPGALRDALPSEAPREPEPFAKIWEDFETEILPAVTHWNHPGFLAYFPANNSGPSILGELLSAALGVNGMLWETCPAATELEEVVLGWLQKLLGLPSDFVGVIQDTASTSTLVALLMAREKATEGRVNQEGFEAGVGLRVYTTDQAHSSILKGARIAGFGTQGVLALEAGPEGAVSGRELAQAIRADKLRGKRPAAAVATVGTTSSTASDPLLEWAEVCRQEGIFFHVDAALAGAAALLPEKRSFFRGIEAADSFVFNPHKWLYTNFDCSAHFVRDPELLVRTFAVDAAYLKTDRDGAVRNLRDWGIALGRRFRALKLWFVLRYFGVEGLQAKLRHALELAQEFASFVRQSELYQLEAGVPFQTVCFTRKTTADCSSDPDEVQLELARRIRQDGRFYLTHTRIGGKTVLRASFGQGSTRSHHLQALKDLLEELGPQVLEDCMPGDPEA